MDAPKKDYSEEMANWLVDLGHRNRVPAAVDPVRPAASAEDLVRYLETLSGRQFRSHEDVLQLLKDFWQENVEAARAARRQRLIRETLLLGVLAVSYLHNYYWEVRLQIASLPALQVFVPVSPPKTDQRTHYLIRSA
jgi:MoxR-like ATPase